MHLKSLRKRCEAHLRDFPIPVPFDLHVLIDAIAVRRGRSIELYAWQIPLPDMSGICIALTSRDRIYYNAQTSPLHQQHIILHELCHLFCGHEGVAGDELKALLFPDLAERLFSLRRQKYATIDEQEAELLASLVLERVYRTQAYIPVPDLRTTNVLRLLDSLEGMTFE